MRGRGKGQSYERAICRQLSLWWSGGTRDDIYWRTAGSGARSKTRSKTGRRTFGQYGDVQAVDPVGRPLLDLLTIEIKKGYSKEPAFNAIDVRVENGNRQKSKWERFVDQAIADSRNAGTQYWMLIHRRNGRTPCVFIPCMLYDRLHNILRPPYCRPACFLTTSSNIGIFGCPIDQFLACVCPDDIRSIRRRIIVRKR